MHARTMLPPPDYIIPRQCACGQVHSPIEWRRLEYVGVQDDGDGLALELRNCTCGSTMSVELERE